MSSEGIDENILIFISYGRRDAHAVQFADEIATYLESNGYQTWLDTRNGIPPGTPFNIQIENGIKDCTVLLAVLSRWSMQDECFCRNEFLFARFLNKPILPVRIDEREPPLEIISLNFIDLSLKPPEFQKSVAEAIEQVIEAKHFGYRAFDEIGSQGWWVALRSLHFDEELARYGEPLRGREWFLHEISLWIQREKSRILLVTAHAGMGKSVIAAHLSSEINVRSLYFCSWTNAESCSPKSWLECLIFQLASQFPRYRSSIESLPPLPKEFDAAHFRQYVTDPLLQSRELENCTDQMVFVIDGLDEAIARRGTDFLEFLAEAAPSVPSWMRIIVFSRPDRDVVTQLSKDNIEIITLKPESEGNRGDIEGYIKSRLLNDTIQKGANDKYTECKKLTSIITKITELSEGNFLYARLLLDDLTDPASRKRITLDEIDKLPKRIDGIYYSIFKHRFGNRDRYQQGIAPILQILVAATEPIPYDLLKKSSGLGGNFHDHYRQLSQFTRQIDDGIVLFHRSLIEWLVDPDHQGEFLIDPVPGHVALAQTCQAALLDRGTEPSPFVLRTLPYHWFKADEPDKAKGVVTDPLYLVPAWKEFEFSIKSILAALCESKGTTVRDIYTDALMCPSAYSHDFLVIVAQILLDRGYLTDAIKLFQLLLSQSGDEEERSQKYLGKISWAYYLKGSIDEALKAAKRQEEICYFLDDKRGLQEAYLHIGTIFHDVGNETEALEYFEKAEKICRSLNDTYWLQKSIGNQGLVRYSAGDLDKALELFQEQERICSEIGHIEGRIKSLGNQGGIHHVRGEYGKALTCFEMQEDLSRSIGYQRGVMFALGNRGQILLSEGKLKDAYRAFGEQKRLAESMESLEGKQMAYANLGLYNQIQGRFDVAEEYYYKQLEISKKLFNVEGEQAALGRLANILLLKGEYHDALKLYKKQEEICRAPLRPDWLQGCLGNQAVANIQLGHYDEASGLLSEQEEICRRLPNYDGLQRCLGLLGRISEDRGDIDGAIKYYNERLGISQQFDNIDGQIQALDELISAYTTSGEQELAKGAQKIKQGLIDGSNR